MKSAVASLFAIFVAASAQAGSFGGPPPFSNGSPLPTGIDGNYQGVARGNNVSGVFRFQISNGMQSSSATTTDPTTDVNNSWVFFVEGEVYRGATQVGISDSTVSGVLDSGQQGSSDVTFPLILTSSLANGEFNGKLDQNSSIGSFEGDGIIASSGQEAGTVVYVGNVERVIFPPGGGAPVTIEVFDSLTVNVPGQPGFGNKSFSFRGTRNNNSVVSSN